MPYIGMILWLVATGAAAFVLSQFNVAAPWRYLIACVASLPSILIALGLVRSVGRQDEMFRRIHFEAIAFAAILVWLLTFSWGTLELLQLVPRIPAFLIAFAVIVLYGFGVWRSRRRYQ